MFDMIGNVLKNLTSRPATSRYPYVKRKLSPQIRGMITGIEPDVCIYCGICQKKCPSHAIVVDRPNKEWTIETFKCIICKECVLVCPKKCINMKNEHATSSTTQTSIVCKATKPEVVDEKGSTNA